MKKIYSVILLLAVMLSSCTKDETDIMTDDNSNAPALAKTRSDGSDMVEYELLPNPYTVDVIQGVYDSYNVSKTIEPTDLYVRFLPQDSLQLIALKNDYDLELFDYPLNIELPEDAVYQDTTIPEGSFTWLYTTVKPDFAFPKEIPYEVIEECYIPAEDETISPTRGGIINVEEAAFLSLGYPLEEQEPETRGKRRPEGTIRVYDDYAGAFVPVKGVKIRCHRFIKCLRHLRTKAAIIQWTANSDSDRITRLFLTTGKVLTSGVIGGRLHGPILIWVGIVTEDTHAI